MRQPKVLVFDIETAPIIASVWELFDQNVAVNQIVKDRHVIAWSAKWLDDPVSKVMYKDQRGRKNMEDDRALLKPLWKLLDEADIVITQNGKRFDSRRLNARFIQHGMPPPSPYKHIDTYLVARTVADFSSNKLEFLTNKLCKKYKKLQHKKFAGFKLWKECLADNTAAWNEMKLYNIHDVLATEELYHVLKPWMSSTLPNPYVVDDMTKDCVKCGAKGSINKRGFTYARNKRVQILRCRSCKRAFHGLAAKVS